MVREIGRILTVSCTLPAYVVAEFICFFMLGGEHFNPQFLMSMRKPYPIK